MLFRSRARTALLDLTSESVVASWRRGEEETGSHRICCSYAFCISLPDNRGFIPYSSLRCWDSDMRGSPHIPSCGYTGGYFVYILLQTTNSAVNLSPALQSGLHLVPGGSALDVNRESRWPWSRRSAVLFSSAFLRNRACPIL